MRVCLWVLHALYACVGPSVREIIVLIVIIMILCLTSPHFFLPYILSILLPSNSFDINCTAELQLTQLEREKALQKKK